MNFDRVAHLTSVHARYDTRIFQKMCSSLATHGCAVSLVVADGLGEEWKNGVHIIDVGARTGGRLSRMTRTVRRVFDQAKALNADIYHLHDPELIPVGLKLKRAGMNVIMDFHEDVPKQLLSKPYLSPALLRVLSVTMRLYERYACPRFDGIIAATPFIRDKFLAINPRCMDINNFPMVGELDAAVPWTNKRKEVCYVGGIGAIRGAREIVKALEYTSSDARLNLAGRFSEPAVESEVKSYPRWDRVNELGFVDRAAVREVLGRSMAGLVTFLPLPNHLDAQPNKMFEYMSAGIPVIASDFPLWRDIIVGNDCGLCVDPLDPLAIAGAIDFLVKNPERARQMGENGRHAVLVRYNWAMEESKLIDFYRSIMEVRS